MRWTLRLAAVLAIVAGIGVWWGDLRTLQAYLDPLPPATLTKSEIIMGSLNQTREYSAPVDVFDVHKFKFLGHTRRWHAYTPQGEVMGGVVLLHGSNRNGAAMIDMWKAAADQHGLVLIAPDSREPEGWSSIKDGGRFMARVATDAQEKLGIDIDNWFLFGHSAGAVFAMTLVQSDSVPWRAVSAHAGGPSPDSIRPAMQAVPYRAYIGEDDHLFSVAYIESGTAAIAQAGHPSELIVIKEHTHWLYDIGPKLADDAARWFLAAAN